MSEIMKNKKSLRTGMIVLILLSIPHLVFANTSSDISSIDGAKNLVNLFNLWIRGVGALVLMFGSAETFMNIATENIEHRTRGFKCICCGLLMICSYSIICAICDIGNYNGFQVLISIVALFLEFIGAMSAMYGAYSFISSIKDQNAEAKQKAIKVFFGGLAVIAVAQSSSSFLL